jgi:CBS domain-containing protein
MMERAVQDIKRLGIVACREHDRLRDIVKRMADDDISALVVVDAQNILRGIISRSDLLAAYVDDPDWAGAHVAKYMTRQVVTVPPTTPLSEAVRLLLGQHIHRLVVVSEDEDGVHPIAVVSDSDIVTCMADNPDLQAIS